VFDQLSFDATSVTLDEHLGSVGEAARRIGEAVGLAAPLISAVDLAGRFHDLGKLDARFQLWLDPEHKHADPVAKSELRREQLESARIASGWPRGGRHELVSGQLLCSWLDGHRLDAGVDEELVVHLVLSHHGHARPSVPIVAAETLEVSAEISAEQVTIAADLSRPDWSQPARFRVLCERYGYWGLALLEAVVRQADQAASSAVVA
jgi:CRISPR-associated endonuclease/helicase Cas3